MFIIQISKPEGQAVFYKIGSSVGLGPSTWETKTPSNATWFSQDEREIATVVVRQINQGKGGYGFPAGTTAELLTLAPAVRQLSPTQLHPNRNSTPSKIRLLVKFVVEAETITKGLEMANRILRGGAQEKPDFYIRPLRSGDFAPDECGEIPTSLTPVVPEPPVIRAGS